MPQQNSFNLSQFPFNAQEAIVSPDLGRKEMGNQCCLVLHQRRLTVHQQRHGLLQLAFVSRSCGHPPLILPNFAAIDTQL